MVEKTILKFNSSKEPWVRGFNLDKETYEMLTDFAKKYHISRSAALRFIISKHCAEGGESSK
jgi:hypothetical protein